jgi:hypothetical protein
VSAPAAARAAPSRRRARTEVALGPELPRRLRRGPGPDLTAGRKTSPSASSPRGVTRSGRRSRARGGRAGTAGADATEGADAADASGARVAGRRASATARSKAASTSARPRREDVTGLGRGDLARRALEQPHAQPDPPAGGSPWGSAGWAMWSPAGRRPADVGVYEHNQPGTFFAERDTDDASVSEQGECAPLPDTWGGVTR